ncbi:MAG: carboxylating nicotinate-nucleotide diphosphorylase [Verrucomicrobiales bacterium]
MPIDPATSTLIDLALAEDIGTGDLTAAYFVSGEARSVGRIAARQPGVLAGSDIAAEVFRRVDPVLKIERLREDGAALQPGDACLEVSGASRSILTAERTALNFLQRLSGVATLARRFADAVAGTGAAILDTRKTTPGWRRLEKAAAVAGGAANHRMGLYDAAMVKDNHLAAEDRLAALQDAIDRLRADRPDAWVEVEADTLDQVRAFLTLRGVRAILLDNMPPPMLREAVALNEAAGKPVALEASGGVNLATVRAIAESGVDFISVGAITHSAPALDLGMDFIAA